MNILEKVAWAICDHSPAELTGDLAKYDSAATAAITAFLEAAAEQGWHIQPDEATEEMVKAVKLGGWQSQDYHTMQAAAPKFEWDKKTSAKPGKPPPGGI